MITAEKSDPRSKLTLEFSASKADSMLKQMVEERINELKVQRLSKWVRDHSSDLSEIDQKIADLEWQKEQLSELINKDHQRPVNLYLK